MSTSVRFASVLNKENDVYTNSSRHKQDIDLRYQSEKSTHLACRIHKPYIKTCINLGYLSDSPSPFTSPSTSISFIFRPLSLSDNFIFIQPIPLILTNHRIKKICKKVFPINLFQYYSMLCSYCVK